MSFDPVSAALDVAGKVIDKIFPDPAQRDAAKIQMMQLQQTSDFKQIELDAANAIEQLKVSAVEAASESAFVGGGRPAAMWVCVAGMAYTFILSPVMSWLALIKGWPVPPQIDTSMLMQLLLGMLGLAGIRSYDKTKGVASK